MHKRLISLTMLAVALASVSHAQKIEVTPHVGYKWGGSVPVQSEEQDINKIKFDPSMSAGVNVGYNFTENFGVEFLWNRQFSKATGLLSEGGEFQSKISVNLDEYFGNLVYNFRDEDAKLRPFLLGGMGATRASGGGSAESRVSFNVGGGVKYFFHNNMGLRMQIRWNPTYLYSTSGGVWCNWWGGCYVIPNDHYMNQGEATIGWIFRF